MISKKYFPSAIYYICPENEDYLESLEGSEIIKFRESVLNELVVRIERSHHKIQLLWVVLAQHHHNKNKILCGNITLEEEIIIDALLKNILEISEVTKNFYIAIKSTIPAQFGALFKRIGKNKLKDRFDDEFIKYYNKSRVFLFPSLSNEVSVKDQDFSNLSKRLENNAKKLLNYRDKIIAHQYDEDRFEVSFTYEEYLNIHTDLVQILNAISIVTTFRDNNWKQEESFVGRSYQAKKWLVNGLRNSLKTYKSR